MLERANEQEGRVRLLELAINFGVGAVLVNLAAYALITARASVWGIPHGDVEVDLYALMSPLVVAIVLPTIVLGPVLLAL